MPTQFDVTSLTLSSALGSGGSASFAYPSNRSAGDYQGGNKHHLISNQFNPLLAERGEITVEFAASTIVLTNNSATAMPAGLTVYLHLDRGEDLFVGRTEFPSTSKMMGLSLMRVDLGVPITADPDGICEAQSDTGAHTLTLDGALVTGGVAVLDVPRNIVIDSGGVDTAVLTITGTDEYGNVMKENITLNGTTAVAGKKAFKTVTSVTSSATIANGAFVGTGDVLGLPVFVDRAGDLIAEFENAAAPTAGTLVVGDKATPTATTGDVRGTYDPNSACNGSLRFELDLKRAGRAGIGRAQYAG